MNREIKFRGKTPEGKWVYGVPYFVKGEPFAFIINNCQTLHLTNEDTSFQGVRVLRETIGQFTGFKDNRGNDIYDGDLVKAKGFVPETYRIEFIEGGFCLTNPDLNGYPTDINIMYPSYGCQIEVIDNVHDKETEVNHG